MARICNSMCHKPESSLEITSMIRFATQFFIIHVWDFNVDIDSIEQRTRDSLLVFGHSCFCTGARFLSRIVESTRAGMYTNGPVFVLSRNIRLILKRFMKGAFGSGIVRSLRASQPANDKQRNIIKPFCFCNIRIKLSTNVS